ncbi:MAG: dienelactone hydrolase family protein [Gemmatimonadaceae bacterium]|nr:dienelactone hydrolase family protein [Gemmatimonadaceae bacterium]
MSIDVRRHLALLSAFLLAACSQKAAVASEHADHASPAADTHTPSSQAPSDTSIPPAGQDAKARLAASPRHGEWVMIPVGGSPADSVRAWVVYPERSTKAPVVVVVHEIFGLTTWVRAVADQLAADGFIAIAPDLLTGKHIPTVGPDSINTDSAIAAIRTLDPNEVQRRLSAAAKYGMALPAALPRYGIVGFCWGGSVSFAHAVAAPDLGASVVYYGTSPKTEDLAKVRAPVLGLYGQNDARVTSTIPPADSALHALGRTYEHFVFPGAGHGFLRAQNGQNGANFAAAKQAWPKTIAWFRKYLGG